MFNSIFGELEYEYGWNGNTNLDWYGNNINVEVVIAGEEDEEIDETQCESYQEFIKNWEKIKEVLLDSILSYYVNLRDELGYSNDSNENYPEITNSIDLKEKITLDSIVIPLSGIYDGRSVALAFHCDWDEENGLGVVLVNEKISDIGYNDIAF